LDLIIVLSLVSASIIMPTFTDTRLNHLFDHILLESDVEGEYHHAIAEYQGITNIYDLLAIPAANIEVLKYKLPGKGNRVQLGKGLAMKLIYAIKYIAHMNNTQNSGLMLAEDEFIKLTAADFREWCNIEIHKNVVTLPIPPPPSSTVTTTSKPVDPVHEFDKGIKRDPTAFPKLKDERFWDQYLRSTHAVARTQKMISVFDKNYMPTTASDKELFERQQAYMYAVAESTLLVDKGQELVRKYKDTFDAQKIYQELLDYHAKSTKATQNASELLSYITSNKLGTDSWNGSSESYVTHWRETVRQYHDLVDKKQRLTEETLLVMLQNAVHPITELRAVKERAESDCVINRTIMNYSQYCTLLQSACQQYDSSNGSTCTRRPPSRRVYTHDLHDGSDTYDQSFDIDTPMDVICAFAAAQVKHQPGSHMQYPVWNSLPSKDQQIWDQLSDETKAAILQGKPLSTPSSQRPPVGITRPSSSHGPSTPACGNCMVNLHEISVHDYITMIHESQHAIEIDTDHGPPQSDQDHDADDTHDDSNTATILAHITKREQVPPGDIKHILSTALACPKSDNASTSTSSPTSASTRQVKMHEITYVVSQHDSIKLDKGALMDRGANGNVGGDDVRIISLTGRNVNIQGVDFHQVQNIPIGTVGAKIWSQHGPFIGIFPQTAILGRGRTILSCAQLEYFGMSIDDKSVKVGGKQCLRTIDGYMSPINFYSGLPYLRMVPYTDEEWETLPHVIMSIDQDWDPTILDHVMDEDEQWFDALEDPIVHPGNSDIDEYGKYRHRHIAASTNVQAFRTAVVTFDDNADDRFNDLADSFLDAVDYAIMYNLRSKSRNVDPNGEPSTVRLEPSNDPHPSNELDLSNDPAPDPNIYKPPQPRTTIKQEPNYDAMHPLFAWLPVDVIKETFARTTQMARMPMSETLKNFFRSMYPALNIPRRHEPVATNTVYSDTPAIDDGVTCAQLFFGTKTTLTDVYGMKSDKQFVSTLEDNIHARGAMDSLLSDSAQVEISNKVKSILRNLFIRNWQSEPYKQQQNPAERRFQTVKCVTNNVLDHTGAPAYTWLLCLMYVCFVLNHIYNQTVNSVPITLATGQPDISPLLHFHFWQKVNYRREEHSGGSFPSDSPELIGHWVGIFEHVGHSMTYKILTEHNKVVPHSAIRAVDNDMLFNKHTAPLRREDVSPVVKSAHDNDTDLSKSPSTLGTTMDDHESEQIKNTPTLAMPVFDPNDLVGRTFLHDSSNDDGQRFRVRIVEALNKHHDATVNDPRHIQFRVSINDDQYEELLSYYDIVDYINNDEHEENNRAWNFKKITAHEGPLKPNDPSYNGSMWNVMVEWENGEITSEPLSVITADDPVLCAIYARDHNLLQLEGWKLFAHIAQHEKKMLRMVNQAKLRSYRQGPKYQYGFQVPHDYAEAMRFDQWNGNDHWKESVKIELAQIDIQGPGSSK
jgi:hypothetical protein